MTNTIKQKKIAIIATWLHQGEKILGKQTPLNVSILTHSLLIDQRINDEIYFDCDWTLDDAYSIAEQAHLEPIDECAFAILRALRTKISSRGLKRCSECRKEKPLTEYTGYDRYCRSCRQKYNLYRRLVRHGRSA